MDEDESFPRGRAAASSEASASAASESDGFLFGEKKRSGGTSSKKAKKKRKTSDVQSEADADAVAENAMVAPKNVHLLTYKRLSVGMGLLGQVAEVKDHTVVLSLPDNLTGHVAFLELSERHAASAEAGEDADDPPPPSELMSVGDLVRCVVVNLHKSRGHATIDVSLRPSLLNAGLTSKSLVDGLGVCGTVGSVEDHGYTVDLGIAGTSGFVRFDEAPSRSWNVGRPVECVVKELQKRKANKRVVLLGALPEQVAGAAVRDFPGLSLNSLQAGMLVNVRVASVLKGGITVTFLRHFVGVVDMLHLTDGCVGVSKTDLPKEGDKRAARILYVDQVNKVVGLTLKTGLLKLQAPVLPVSVRVGTTFESAEVVRVDAKLGLYLKLPGADACTGFAHISRLSDERIDKIGRKHSAGTTHQCRVVSHSLIDGMANVSLEESILAAPFLTYSDVTVGSAVSGKIISVEPYGVIVSLTDRIRGLIPSVHLGELLVKNPETKFKPGKKVKCHVLSVDAAKSRVVLSMKTSFCESDTPRIMQYSDVKPGTVCTGFISAIKDFGCILTFFNDVHGLVPRDQLGIEGIIKGETQPEECFRVGQTVQAKALSCTPAESKMLLTLDLASTNSSNDAPQKSRCRDLVGTCVSGTVLQKSAEAVEFRIDGDDEISGKLEVEHLSDHDALVEGLLDTYEVGQLVENMLVLQASGMKNLVTLTVKPSLVKAAASGSLPRDIDSISIGDMLHGYVSNVTHFGVFVNFLSSFSGLALKSNIADEFVTDPSNHFEPGQTVRARVLKIDLQAQKLELSLKQSDCESEDASYLTTHFADVCKIANVEKHQDDELQWYAALSIGGTVDGTVESMKYGGVIVDLGNDVTGFVKQEHCDGVTCEVGQTVTARILDADPRKAIVDLSLLPDLIKSSKKKSAKVKVGSRAQATVRLVKNDYLVVTLDKSGSICFANCHDYNSRIVNAQSIYSLGSAVEIQIMRAGGKVRAGNQHESCALAKIVSEHAPEQTRKKQKTTFTLENDLNSLTDVKVGMVTTGQINKIHRNHMTVILGPKIPGRVHMSDVSDDDSSGTHVFSSFEVGQRVSARVIGVDGTGEQTFVDLSLRPSVIKAADLPSPASLSTLKPGQTFYTPIEKIDGMFLSVCINRAVRGRIAAVDLSESLATASDLTQHFQPGHVVKSTVIAVDQEKRTVDMSLIAATAIEVGQIRLGLVTRISGEGMFLRLANMQHGRVHVADSSDQLKEGPFKAYQTGQLVECAVVGVDADNIDLSTRESVLAGKPKQQDDIRDMQLADVQEGQKFQGYVRRIAKQGCFVSLSRATVGRIILRELSDSFVSDPAEDFPAGKLVSGVVIKVDKKAGKVDLSLKKKGAGESNTDFEALQVGQKLKCNVKRVETYGIFLSIQKSSCVGLCHRTEVADERVKDLSSKYAPGDFVRAVVLKLNPQKKQISLSMKASHFDGEDDQEDAAPQAEEMDEAEDMGEPAEAATDESDSSEEDDSDDDEADGDAVLSVEDEDFDLGLHNRHEVANADEEDKEDSDNSDDSSSTDDEEEESAKATKNNNLDDNSLSEDDDDKDASDDTSSSEEEDEGGDKHAGKETSEPKEKRRKVIDETVGATAEEVELRMRQREDALADPDAQLLTDDDYQREVIASPNSSIAWIKYMAFQLSVGEIDKARKVVEKALKTINFRKEDEKLNVWVASLNLEKIYGTKESLMQVFERAIMYNDPKQVYVKMVEIHKKAEDYEMVEDLYKIMTRKFKNSADIWCEYGAFKLEQADSAAAKAILEKSLAVLDKKKRASVLTFIPSV